MNTRQVSRSALVTAFATCVVLFFFSSLRVVEAASGAVVPTTVVSDGNSDVLGLDAMVSDVVSSVPQAGAAFDIGSFLGAGAYYGNSTPITGQNAVTYNVEAGHIWNGHESLKQVTSYANSADTWGAGAVAPLYDRHATWVGMLIGGRRTATGGSITQQGIAYGTDLRSAAISTGWSGSSYSLSFGISANSFTTALGTAFFGGDVVNSSFNYVDPSGVGIYTVLTDALVYQNPTTTYVTSAGNSGPGANTVGAPGSGYNTVTVGALGSVNNYNSVSSFSSRGPQDFSYYDANSHVVTVAGVRAVVDIAAPGEGITSAFYGGQTGGNNPTLSGSSNSSSSTSYSTSLAGTSFAAPIVAGGAALVASAAKTLPLLSSNPEAASNLVVKSLLLNGADKTSGWNNGQGLSNGTITTTQGLDYAVGTGRMNLANTFQIQVRGQSSVEGTSSGAQGGVQELGWDYGKVSLGASNDYIISDSLVAGTTFTTTLSWDRIREWDYSSGVLYEDAQANLNLSLWELGNDNSFAKLVAQSSSLYNTVEHLSFQIPDTCRYGLRVGYLANTFDNTGIWGTGANLQDYGIAWNGQALTTLYWTANGTGVWDGTAANWNTQSDSGGTARSATTASSTLVLSAGPNGTETISVGGTHEARGLTISDGSLLLNGGAASSLAVGAEGITLGAAADGDATLASSLTVNITTGQSWVNSSSHDLVVAGSLAGTSQLRIASTGTGAIVLSGNNTRTGTTTISDGTLKVNGSIAASSLTTVSNGGILGGSGTVGDLLVEGGGTIAPGNSPGTLHINGDTIWSAGAKYNWQVYLANPDAFNQSGAGIGWDLLEISGTLALQGIDLFNKVGFNLWSLFEMGPDVSGPLPNYDPLVGSTWLFARAGGGITLDGHTLSANNDYTDFFNISLAAVNGTGGWAGPVPDAGFRIVTLGDANTLYLVAGVTSSVPEPGQVAASLLLFFGAGIWGLRRFFWQFRSTARNSGKRMVSIAAFTLKSKSP